ncbi:hypothetical protein N7470_000850 [Penicillium chermesinum]|nr:hypothetical protein N7470_000850 [Penicillium chermesinum]
MDTLEDNCASLRAQIASTEAQLAVGPAGNRKEARIAYKQQWPLEQEEYKRYGRQMIVSQIGLPGQLRLRSAKVLLVGAGGLGCPAAQYLAGAGVGTIGMVDGDTVEVSNLHRQVLHRSQNVGKYKVDSAIESLKDLNPHPTYIAHRTHLTPAEAPAIFEGYDIILDCTDNPASRYLISDTAVLLGKPLVSASALRTDGQLVVLNNPPRPPGDKHGGPCYRCVFPKPPPADSVVSCADGGIIGPVVGTMGVLQALETIKLITTPCDNISQPKDSPAMHLFSAYADPLFRKIRLRSRRANCAVCSSEATVTLDTIKSGSTDYVFFCGSASLPSLLSPSERVSPRDYLASQSENDDSKGESSDPSSKSPVLIDVRDEAQFGICNLENSINVSRRGSHPDISPGSSNPIYVVCRLGNDSQVAVRKLKDLGLGQNDRFIADIKGGFRAWREQIDPEWPEY